MTEHGPCSVHRVKVSAKLDQIAKYSRPWRRGGHRTTREREWTKLTLNLREICLLHRPTSLFDGSARPQTDAIGVCQNSREMGMLRHYAHSINRTLSSEHPKTCQWIHTTIRNASFPGCLTNSTPNPDASSCGGAGAAVHCSSGAVTQGAPCPAWCIACYRPSSLIPCGSRHRSRAPPLISDHRTCSQVSALSMCSLTLCRPRKAARATAAAVTTAARTAGAAGTMAAAFAQVAAPAWPPGFASGRPGFSGSRSTAAEATGARQGEAGGQRAAVQTR